MEKMTTKDRILDSALTLFSEKGYDGVGVDLIAENAGIKGPSLYKHFKGKEDILNALIEKAEQAAREEAERKQEELQQAVECRRQELLDSVDLLRQKLEAGRDRPEPLSAAVEDFCRSYAPDIHQEQDDGAGGVCRLVPDH